MRSLVAVIACVLHVGLARAEVPDKAEASVRAALAGDKNGVKELRRLSWLRLPAFSVTRADDQAHYAIVSAGKVLLSTDKRSNERVAAILKNAGTLAKRELTAADVVFVVHAFGEAPAQIKAALDRQTTGRGVIDKRDPSLTWSSAGAELVVWGPQPSTRRGAEARPMHHLLKATLTISSSYALTWNVTPVSVPVDTP